MVRSLVCAFFFFLMIRRPPRSTLDRSSAASDVYKRQPPVAAQSGDDLLQIIGRREGRLDRRRCNQRDAAEPVSYTHLRAHETVLDLVCRLLLEKKKK